MKVAIFTNLSKQDSFKCTSELIDEILMLKSEVLMLSDQGSYFKKRKIILFDKINDIVKNCDVVITIGGDGTIIHKAKYSAIYSKPILGINLGRVGFVAELEKNEIGKIKELLAEQYDIEYRTMLSVIIKSAAKTRKFFALNDAVISKANHSGIVDLNVTLNKSKMNEYIADGIIFSTPTGSTAYSLSAGGPILEPTLNCILLTPICQHSIFSRSVVFNGKSVLDVTTRTRGEKNKVAISIDGCKPIILTDRDSVSISLANIKIPFIKLKSSNFYEILSSKLSDRKI